MHLADRISHIIQNEPAIRSTAKTTTRNTLIKPVIGFAIAASVTVVVILGVKQSGIGPAATQAPMVAVNHTETSAKYQVARITAEPSVPHQSQNYQASADAQSRLNRYLVNHNEYRSNAGVQGMLPYVRIVAHEVEE
jgi:negative regulator of sigma E activity